MPSPLLFYGLSVLLTALSVTADPSPGALYPPGLQPLINRANALLSAGTFHDAARAYSEAIEQSPVDPTLYYKRATAYFSLGRHANAITDFDQVLALTSDSFTAKEGRWADAREALKHYQAKNDPIARDLLLDVADGEAAARKAALAQKAKLWTACEESATQGLRVASHSVALRQQRANCALAAGDFEEAVGDLSRLTQITAPSTDAYMNIFRISYFYMGSTASNTAMANLKQCLHYDPDSRPCLSAHRLVKSLDKQFKKLDELMAAEDWRGIINFILGKLAYLAHSKALSSRTRRQSRLWPSLLRGKRVPRRAAILRALCRAHVQLRQARSGEQWCDELLRMIGNEKDIDALLGKGEALLAREEWEEAVRTFERAWEASGGGNREIHARLSKAQRLLKQSRTKDYYKVLGVARDADEKTIKKAYRKAALGAHPDKGGSEAKMAVVNEAYEVLSNPELRQRFDNGDDPNDPMQGQGGPFPGGSGGHPFAQFFQQAAGSGFQFRTGGGGGGGPGGFSFHFPGGRR
ncbi:hypothetical protein EDB87DRAFT_1746530 [Lactarius vividus]|nr:hypothetical protein EDB87DRAFT_1746530 [Lactarius vividus]